MVLKLITLVSCGKPSKLHKKENVEHHRFPSTGFNVTLQNQILLKNV